MGDDITKHSATAKDHGQYQVARQRPVTHSIQLSVVNGPSYIRASVVLSGCDCFQQCLGQEDL